MVQNLQRMEPDYCYTSSELSWFEYSGFFHSLKTQVRQICSHYTDREEMMNVLKAFEEYPADKLDGIWGCYYNNLRIVMESDGGNDYKQAHK